MAKMVTRLAPEQNGGTGGWIVTLRGAGVIVGILVALGGGITWIWSLQDKIATGYVEVNMVEVKRNTDAIVRNSDRIYGVEAAVKETRTEVLSKIETLNRERREDMRDIDAKLVRIERKLDR